MMAIEKYDEPRISVPRDLDLLSLVGKKSYFLFGPRQTGKSFLIRQRLQGTRVYNLLDTATFLTLSQNPGRISEEIGPHEKLVVIDEIQRVPTLLNEVHLLIEERGIRFLLTGSSPRKLRRGGVNLLGGRARTAYLHPLTSNELGNRFDLTKALHRGLLPSIYFSDDPDADLAAYAGTYLQEEIAAEGAARNIPAFSRFLKVAALCSGTMINITNIASDAQVPRTTVHEYFEILRDTLLLHELPAWRKSAKRKPIAIKASITAPNSTRPNPWCPSPNSRPPVCECRYMTVKARILLARMKATAAIATNSSCLRTDA